MELGFLSGPLFVFMLFEAAVVLLLCMPMPSNKVRGAVTYFVTSTWNATPALRWISGTVCLIDAFYFYQVVDTLLDPLRQRFGWLIVDDPLVSCEMRIHAIERERNAYITGCSLFLFLVLRRLTDIQGKLHEARYEAKSASAGVPMGQPVPPARSKFD